MKKTIIGIFITALISGCTTTSTPKAHEAKYTFQCLHVTIPSGTLKIPYTQQNGQSGMFPTQSQFEEILNDPGTEVMEFPIVSVGIGKSVTNDQTKAVSLPEDYDIVDGKPVVKEKICKLGCSTSVTVNKVENGAICYHLNVSYQELLGFNENKIENGLSVKMPFFKKRGIDTDLTGPPNSWTMMGGLIDQRSDGTSVHNLICMRVIPPITAK
ncbi:MAG: hypothetical protein OES84_00885 [Kiritimatiellaceae bacterium]|nr:hypothetical protein [Kiritimatiellaceae bacterium]